MFTKDEAVNFLEKSWQVKKVETRLQTDRKKMLDEIIVLIQEKVPFHTLTVLVLSDISPEERTIPSLEEINKICMAGNGGNCTFINLFTYSLLKGLGYSAYLCRTTVTSVLFNPHLVVLIKDLVKNGDLYFVDCGLGLPSFQAVSLDFEEESPVYHDSFLEYKFIRHEGKIFRMHGDGDIVKRSNPPVEGLDFVKGKWRRFCQFTIETIELHSIDDLGPLFSFRYLWFNERPRTVRFPGGRAIMIMADQLLIEKDGRLEATTMETCEQILDSYRKYFPTIKEDLVSEAFAIWRRRAASTSKL